MDIAGGWRLYHSECVHCRQYSAVTGGMFIARQNPLCDHLRGHGRPDLKDCRIRVNAVSPGSIDTPGLSDLLASSQAGDERKKMIITAVPLGRLGAPDEIAKAVVFLASDDSSYITGIELFVDGGFAQV